MLTAINSINGRKGGKECEHAMGLLDTVHAQRNIVHYCHAIFAKIDEMWEHVLRIFVTA